ncbi:hypothetical protein PFISCL1PPCAC_12294, partial [Pristionchus fissidentatus]
SLLDLPDEIIEVIFFHLNFADQHRIRVNKRLMKIAERMEKRGEGSKEMLEEVYIMWHSSSELGITINSEAERFMPFSTVATVIRRLNGHINSLNLGVDPHDPLLGDQLKVICNSQNRMITIFDMLQEGDSPTITVFDLAFFSRLIKNNTEILVAYLNLALTNDDIIDLNKV